MVATTMSPLGRRLRLVVTSNAAVPIFAPLVLFVLVSMPILGVAIAFGLNGAWEVLPASMGVVIALGAGLRSGYRRAKRREVLTFGDYAIDVHRGHTKPPLHLAIPRAQAHVEVLNPQADDGHLLIRSNQGAVVEVGGYLDARERGLLADMLRRWLGEAPSAERSHAESA